MLQGCMFQQLQNWLPRRVPAYVQLLYDNQLIRSPCWGRYEFGESSPGDTGQGGLIARQQESGR